VGAVADEALLLRRRTARSLAVVSPISIAPSINPNTIVFELSPGIDGRFGATDVDADEVDVDEDEVDVIELVGGPMTETALSPITATKISPLEESYATAKGPDPTRTVATTELVASEMTEVVLSSELATKISPLEES
jgi:hypothetical protein